MEHLPAPARHAFLYGFPTMRERAGFLWSAVEEQPALSRPSLLGSGPSGELAWLLARVRGAGGDPVWVDLTTEVAERAGCSVVRVVVPGFVPLARGRHARPLANPRLATVPPLLGFRPLAGFNPDPHPFP
jgi:ribosomal protein S12 methylthiotransferase accessory factor